ncbi:MAG TPA: response regulator transcription factor [Candidatus Binatia bacterium]|nr:response regulator transcription factor [Candidatus Binatia bacterium]
MKILICDDHELFRAGLRLVLTRLEESTELIDASSAEETFRVAEADPDLDLVLMDLGMPGMDGLSALGVLRDRFPALPVVIVSASERDADVRAAIDRGASGFIPKSSSAPVLLAALRLVLSGGVYVPPLILATPAPAPSGAPPATDRRRERAAALTPRQLEVLDLMAKGRTNREICDRLGIAEGTVKAHVATILEALDVANRTEAAAVMRDLGIGAAPESEREVDTPAAESVFRREGEYWTIRHRESECHLRDSKGLRYLAFLLRNPGRECDALEVVAEGRVDAPAAPAEDLEDRSRDPGGPGEFLDAQADAVSRQRLRELDQELAAARGWGSTEQVARLEEEIRALQREVAGAVGIGGHEGRAASASERARENVSRGVKMVLDRLRESSPDLAAHLQCSIKTGTFCSYTPDPTSPIRWNF